MQGRGRAGTVAQCRTWGRHHAAVLGTAPRIICWTACWPWRLLGCLTPPATASSGSLAELEALDTGALSGSLATRGYEAVDANCMGAPQGAGQPVQAQAAVQGARHKCMHTGAGALLTPRLLWHTYCMCVASTAAIF